MVVLALVLCHASRSRYDRSIPARNRPAPKAVRAKPLTTTPSTDVTLCWHHLPCHLPRHCHIIHTPTDVIHPSNQKIIAKITHLSIKGVKISFFVVFWCKQRSRHTINCFTDQCRLPSDQKSYNNELYSLPFNLHSAIFLFKTQFKPNKGISELAEERNRDIQGYFLP